MLQKIKHFFQKVGQFAYSLFVQPVVALKDLPKMRPLERVLSVLNASAYPIFVASFFVSMPSVLVVLASLWVIATWTLALGGAMIQTALLYASLSAARQMADEAAA